MSRRLIHLLVVLALALGMPSAAFAQDGSGPEVPSVDVGDLALGETVSTDKVIDPELATATGRVQVVVRMSDSSLAEMVNEHAKQEGFDLGRQQQRDYLRNLQNKQNELLRQVDTLGGEQLGRVSKALNAVIIEVDAAQLEEVAQLPEVASIRPLRDYQIDLSETVPYIGAKAVQDLGVDGTGVRVAVLDSGIDYLHKNLGGSGSLEEYELNDPSVVEPGTFPTWKVVGGTDFVGSDWASSSDPLAPDPDPLDAGPGAGHGTHVADIIGGKSLDGTHKGVAPGVSLYAVKVCSSVSTSCSGTALLQGMDYALDPNGDGSIDDAVDVINMSLGSGYGQREDDLSAASANAVRMGVVVVASAGNNADRPYITGSPASTPAVISVAQTQVPSAVAYPLVINSPESIAGSYSNTATVDWAPIDTGFTGDVAAVGRGCPAGSVAGQEGEDPYTDDPAGKVALIDRGACAISLKVDRAAKAGAIGVLLALSASGDAVSFSQGGGDTFVPTLVIIRSYGNLIKSALASGPVSVTVSPEYGIPLVQSVVGSSSRGPNYSYSMIKPDIGAPGGSISAEYGTGDGVTAFSGTSGAAPMVAGAAALLIDARPYLFPFEVKALLMNTGETNIQTNPANEPGVLAPITRIGGGEVRVDKAIASKTAAFEAYGVTASLSFGYQSIKKPATFSRYVVVRNYSNKMRSYKISTNFRYAEDAGGAVSISAPPKVVVPPYGVNYFKVTLRVDPAKLPVWDLNGGSRGGDGFRLQGVEYDGYVTVSDATDTVHLAWHILPHRSAEVKAGPAKVSMRGGVAKFGLKNFSKYTDGFVDVFALTGVSDQIPADQLPGNGDNFAIIDLKSVGVRVLDAGDGSYILQFGINTYGMRAHPNYPAEFDVYIDGDRDGVPEYAVFNAENGGFGATGQNVVYVYNFSTGASSAYYYADADLQSSNMIFTVPLDAVGLAPDTTFDFWVEALDNYFTGNVTDQTDVMTFNGAMPRYATDVVELPLAPGEMVFPKLVHNPGGDEASPSQMGLLFLYRDQAENWQADTIIVH
jgi:subtilisin family serine protease